MQEVEEKRGGENAGNASIWCFFCCCFLSQQTVAIRLSEFDRNTPIKPFLFLPFRQCHHTLNGKWLLQERQFWCASATDRDNNRATAIGLQLPVCPMYSTQDRGLGYGGKWIKVGGLLSGMRGGWGTVGFLAAVVCHSWAQTLSRHNRHRAHQSHIINVHSQQARAATDRDVVCQLRIHSSQLRFTCQTRYIAP